MDAGRIRKTLEKRLKRLAKEVSKRAEKDAERNNQMIVRSKGCVSEGEFEGMISASIKETTLSHHEIFFEGLARNKISETLFNDLVSSAYSGAYNAKASREMTKEKEKTEKKYRQAHAKYRKILEEMLKNRIMNANTGYDQDNMEYKQLCEEAEKLGKAANELGNKLSLLDSLEAANAAGALKEFRSDQRYT